MSIAESTQLIHRAKAGSQRALNEVFERYGRPLLALVRLRLGPSLRRQLESRDIVQETMLKAFQKIDDFEGSRSRTLMAWLGVIADNEIRDQARHVGRVRRDVARNVPLDEGLDAIESRIRSEVSRLELEAQAKRLESALDRLSDAHREVIILRKYEELTFEEIGRRLAKSPDASRMLLVRAMAKLTGVMKDLSSSGSV